MTYLKLMIIIFIKLTGLGNVGSVNRVEDKRTLRRENLLPTGRRKYRLIDTALVNVRNA